MLPHLVFRTVESRAFSGGRTKTLQKHNMDGQKILSFIVSQDLSALQWPLHGTPDPWLYHQASLITLSKFYKALQKIQKYYKKKNV